MMKLEEMQQLIEPSSLHRSGDIIEATILGQRLLGLPEETFVHLYAVVCGDVPDSPEYQAYGEACDPLEKEGLLAIHRFVESAMRTAYCWGIKDAHNLKGLEA